MRELYNDLFFFCKNEFRQPIFTNKTMFKEFFKPHFSRRAAHFKKRKRLLNIYLCFEMQFGKDPCTNADYSHVRRLLEDEEKYAYFATILIDSGFCGMHDIIPIFSIERKKFFYIQTSRPFCLNTYLIDIHRFLLLEKKPQFVLFDYDGIKRYDIWGSIRFYAMDCSIYINEQFFFHVGDEELAYLKESLFDERKNVFLVASRWKNGNYFHILKNIALFL